MLTADTNGQQDLEQIYFDLLIDSPIGEIGQSQQPGMPGGGFVCEQTCNLIFNNSFENSVPEGLSAFADGGVFCWESGLFNDLYESTADIFVDGQNTLLFDVFNIPITTPDGNQCARMISSDPYFPFDNVGDENIASGLLEPLIPGQSYNLSYEYTYSAIQLNSGSGGVETHDLNSANFD